jgi:flagellar hook-associated protein 1 FlgK
MNLDTSLSIATSGLASINAQYAVLAQNVANASTPGYAVEVSTPESQTSGDMPLGVFNAPATLQTNQALQSSLIAQNATVSGLQTTQASLQAIDGVLGTPGSTNDLGSLIGNLTNSFTTLLQNPSNATQQSTVVSTAQTLAEGINTLSNSYATQRQAAQNDLQSQVTTLNNALSSIGAISAQIVALKGGGLSTADLENQRNEAVQTLSKILNIRTVEQPSGDMTIFTPTGMTLPTNVGATPFSLAGASTAAGSYYPGGGIPGIMLRGSDVTSQIVGGQMGADITLRDTTIPTSQGELDELAEGLASRFAGQGLNLFTDGSGNVPQGGGTPAQSGYVGFASTIQVNSAVVANPSLVRDGTNAVSAIGFTPNPAGGPAGFTTLLSNIVNFALGSQVQTGTAQPAMNTSGLGATGTLNANFDATGDTLQQFATSLISSQSQQSATTTSNLNTEQALQTSLTSKIQTVSGVNMDTEMSQMLVLQNAYGANAKIMTAMQSMFTAILDAVQ